MGKFTVVQCDVCGKDIAKKFYLCMTVRAVRNGNVERFPAIYICRECYLRDIKIPIMMHEPEKEESNK